MTNQERTYLTKRLTELERKILEVQKLERKLRKEYQNIKTKLEENK